ncbi:MAG: O-antigen ligase family protein [Ruminococcaceae bacterium]|nr:O-antigen ligase family protein [Oscillospiraceae bacterium]
MINRCRNLTAEIISGEWFIPSLLLVTALSMCTGLNLAGALAMGAVTVWLLLFSDDTLAALCPVMFAVMGLTSYYSNYYALLDYVWLLSPIVPALAVHIIAYRGERFTGGRFLPSLIAVSLSLVLGGIGTISPAEYFSGISFYYIIGLGAGLVLLYMLVSSRLSRRRSYDIVERFAELLYAMAILAALLIALFYLKNWHTLMQNFKTPFIAYRNFCTTIMLFGMPMCCLFIRRNSFHLFGMAFIYAFMLIGGSRSAMFFGTLELMLCLGYIYVSHPEKRREYRIIAMISALPVMLVGLYLLDKFFLGETGRFSKHFIRPDEARPGFYRQGLQDFLSRPILGYGIANMKNAGIYKGINGSIIFYHNAVLQVMGSLGLVGCAAYLWQMCSRVRLLWKKRHRDAFVMVIPYIGILLMSMTNPGLFCPMPTAALLVVMFAVVEYENSPVRIYARAPYRRAGSSGQAAHAGAFTAGSPNR